MSLYKNQFRIESVRLKTWDYRNSSWYFVTINTKNQTEYFGKIINGAVELNDLGKTAKKYWLEIPIHFPFAELDYYTIMPNHTHSVIIINSKDVACNVSTKKSIYSEISPKQYSLSSIIRSYKSAVTRWCNKNDIQFEWQVRFFDRIIRDEKELYNIRKYIEQNLLKRILEKDGPDNIDWDLI